MARDGDGKEESAGRRLSLTDEQALRRLMEDSRETEIETLHDVPPPVRQRHQDLPPGTLVGRYVVQRKIGQGGMGAVYHAFDPDLERKVALKLLAVRRGNLSRARERLQREAHVLARLSHPNVITVYDAGIYGDSIFIAMEFAAGVSLRRWLKQQHPSWRRIMSVMLQAGQGLAAAHGAGIIHRDFKPENIIVSTDERAWVLDFGLARASLEEVSPLPVPLSDDSSPFPPVNSVEPLTVEGVLMGTPGYIAPEQYRGEPVDARSDQFSFCVTLFEALYGCRPFSGKSHRELRDNILAGKVCQPPADSKVPARIHAALLRGLSADPRQRYPSLSELLQQLHERPRLVGYRRPLLAAALLLLLGVGLFVWSGRPDLPCQGVERQLQGVWDERVKGRVQRAFRASGAPAADDSYRLTAAVLDRYARHWQEAASQACVAAYERPAEIFDRRRACLQRHLGQLRALTSLFAGSSDKQVVDQAVQAAASLPRIQECADDRRLASPVAPPPGQARVEVERIQARLDDAEARLRTGRYHQGTVLAREAVDAARHLGYRPLLSRALQLYGWLSARDGKIEAAQESLRQACTEAAASGVSEVLARAALQLLYVESNLKVKPAQGLLAMPVVDALITLAGDDVLLRARFLCDTGLLLLRSGEKSRALGNFQKARELLAGAMGEDHPEVAHTLNLAGNALVEMKDYRAARKTLEKALQIWRRTLGPTHPRVAIIYNNLADVLSSQGEVDKALEYIKRTLAIYRQRLGADHPKVGIAYTNLAMLMKKQGRCTDSLEYFRRAAGIFRKSLGEDHPLLAYCLDGEGGCLLAAGVHARSVALLERALAIRRQGRVPEKLRAETMFALARALWGGGGDRGRALSLARRARALFAGSDAAKGRLVSAWMSRHQRSDR